MSWVKKASKDISAEELEDFLAKNTRNINHSSGNCGTFAIALADFLGIENTMMVWVELGDREIFNHVAVEYKGELFDGNGSVGDEQGMLEAFSQGDDGAEIKKMLLNPKLEDDILEGTMPSISVAEFQQQLAEMWERYKK